MADDPAVEWAELARVSRDAQAQLREGSKPLVQPVIDLAERSLAAIEESLNDIERDLAEGDVASAIALAEALAATPRVGDAVDRLPIALTISVVGPGGGIDEARIVIDGNRLGGPAQGYPAGRRSAAGMGARL